MEKIKIISFLRKKLFCKKGTHRWDNGAIDDTYWMAIVYRCKDCKINLGYRFQKSKLDKDGNRAVPDSIKLF